MAAADVEFGFTSIEGEAATARLLLLRLELELWPCASRPTQASRTKEARQRAGITKPGAEAIARAERKAVYLPMNAPNGVQNLGGLEGVGVTSASSREFCPSFASILRISDSRRRSRSPERLRSLRPLSVEVERSPSLDLQ
jgi:hypothetical protein